MKFIYCTSIKTNLNTRFGTKAHMVTGLLYDNLDKAIIGKQTYTLWLNADTYNVDKSWLGKDVWCDFTPSGKVYNLEVKNAE